MTWRICRAIACTPSPRRRAGGRIVNCTQIADRLRHQFSGGVVRDEQTSRHHGGQAFGGYRRALLVPKKRRDEARLQALEGLAWRPEP